MEKRLKRLRKIRIKLKRIKITKYSFSVPSENI